jgi:hypothetical protein
MKISLSTQSPARLEADLVVAVIDSETNLFEADDSRLGHSPPRPGGFPRGEVPARLFQTFDEKESVKALLVFSTSFQVFRPLGERQDRRRALSYASDYGLSKSRFSSTTPRAWDT